MTGPTFSNLYCSVCGRVMGKRRGLHVVPGLVCDNPICQFQDPPAANQTRDALIVAAALAEVPASQIAFSTGVSRQRVYQIVDAWKVGQ